MQKGLVVLIIALLLGNSTLHAQYDIKDSLASGVLFNMSYAAQEPGGDLANRFGFNSNAQLGVYYKSKTNWLLGVQGAFIFGNTLRETNIFDSIATPDNNLITNDGSYASITYFERGYDVQLSVGKIFAFKKPNPNSGILVMVSGGYLRHKIDIKNKAGWPPQITGSYVEGYDRLTAGYCVTEFIGYQYLSNHRMINFFAGFEFTQGFTKSLRFDFNTESMNTATRHDLLNGFRVGWILPIYKQASNQFYTY